MSDAKRNLYFYLPDLPEDLRQQVIKWWKARQREELDYQLIEKQEKNTLPVELDS